MSLKIEDVRYGANNVYSAYVAVPELAKTPLPAIIVIQEAWGVDAHIEDVTRRFAEAGYVAFAPDIFAKDGKRPEPLSKPRLAELVGLVNKHGPVLFSPDRDKALASEPKDVAARAAESMGAVVSSLGNPANVEPVVAASAFLRDSFAPSKGRKVGVVGYCMGGKLALQAATLDPKLSASVMYYGAPPDEEGVKKITCPVACFVGKKDDHVMGAMPAFAAAMKKHGKSYEEHLYENAGHAFSNDRRPSYDVDATRDAAAKTAAFFLAHLV